MLAQMRTVDAELMGPRRGDKRSAISAFGQTGPNQLRIFFGERKRFLPHLHIVPVGPARLHDAGLGMPASPLQDMCDLMNQHVGQNVRRQLRLGRSTVYREMKRLGIVRS